MSNLFVILIFLTVCLFILHGSCQAATCLQFIKECPLIISLQGTNEWQEKSSGAQDIVRFLNLDHLESHWWSCCGGQSGNWRSDQKTNTIHAKNEYSIFEYIAYLNYKKKSDIRIRKFIFNIKKLGEYYLISSHVLFCCIYRTGNDSQQPVETFQAMSL